MIGGAVLHIRSSTERSKLLSNEKFKETGLEVFVRSKPRPKLTVIGVDKSTSFEVFMEQLCSVNLKNAIKKEDFDNVVKIVTPWSSKEAEKSRNVTKESTDVFVQTLLKVGRGTLSSKYFAYGRMQSIWTAFVVCSLAKDCNAKCFEEI